MPMEQPNDYKMETSLNLPQIEETLEAAQIEVIRWGYLRLLDSWLSNT